MRVIKKKNSKDRYSKMRNFKHYKDILQNTLKLKKSIELQFIPNF
jgi:hypothetical protein